MSDFTILVVHCPKPEYEDRIHKYKDKRYKIINCYDRDLLTDEELEEHHFMWNAKKEHRKKVVSCYKSHLQVWEYIIENDLKNVIVLEDDAYIKDDMWEELEKLRDFNHFCYIGGSLGWKLTSKTGIDDVKDFNKRRRKEIGDNLKKGEINLIKTEDRWRIGHTLGLYYPDATEVFRIKEALLENQEGRKKRPIDNELILLQKIGIINYFFYPAISVLNLPDAKNGFNGSYMMSTQEFY